MVKDDSHAERLARAKACRDELDAKFRSYDGGDRPMAPPVSLLRECLAADAAVREIESEAS
jgi:hypothetical protein